MYHIEKEADCLSVVFKGDFDFSTVKCIINDLLITPEFCCCHDIWMVGKHRAQVRLGEIQSIVENFSKLCPKNACNKKTAFVAEPGLTSAILELLASGLDRKLPLSCRIFETREAAEEWLGFKKSSLT